MTRSRIVHTQRHCSVCQTSHQVPMWLYQEEAGERRYICLETYLDRPSEQEMWRRLYEPD